MNKIKYDFVFPLRNYLLYDKISFIFKKFLLSLSNKDQLKFSYYCLKLFLEENNLKEKFKFVLDKTENFIINFLKRDQVFSSFNYNFEFVDPENILEINCNTIFSSTINILDLIFNYDKYLLKINLSNLIIKNLIIILECLYDYVNDIKITKNIDSNILSLSIQYLQTLLRSTKQFNIENPYSNHIKQIVKQDVDKLELVDYNMLLDISNEHYNIDLSEFSYDNIFSRRNLIEMIRREYQ